MTDILIWVIGALAAVGGVILGRLLGQAEGKRAGREEAYQDELHDQTGRLDTGRKAVAKGRDAGTPADRLRDNDGAW
jgi:uncharacterized membrane-anchored protein YhcB (DUF1043 family)